MRRQGLHVRKPKRPQGIDPSGQEGSKVSRPAETGLHRGGAEPQWCGDINEIPSDEGKLFPASALDLCGRRLLACPMSEHADAELAGDAMKMAVAVRGGRA
jgi:transposase InsO family protein